jgi:hypothetical protein
MPDPFAGTSMEIARLARALADGPLDTYQLAADLAAVRRVVDTWLDGAVEAGLIGPFILGDGRSAWKLTERGRAAVESSPV